MAANTESLIKDIRTADGATIVSLSGDVDLHHSPALHATLVQLANDRPKRLMIDMSDVPYIDSSGIGTFVEVYRRLAPFKGKLVFFGLNDRVRSVFEITKLDKFFTICNTEQEAVQA